MRCWAGGVQGPGKCSRRYCTIALESQSSVSPWRSVGTVPVGPKLPLNSGMCSGMSFSRHMRMMYSPRPMSGKYVSSTASSVLLTPWRAASWCKPADICISFVAKARCTCLRFSSAQCSLRYFTQSPMISKTIAASGASSPPPWSLLCARRMVPLAASVDVPEKLFPRSSSPNSRRASASSSDPSRAALRSLSPPARISSSTAGLFEKTTRWASSSATIATLAMEQKRSRKIQPLWPAWVMFRRP
mmetsp:Transcript_52476/g.147813  ORF Transcript_52476/g.147813 Transcript_52476/m.147813 type:complete len:245 (-) Transcript_52476:733-1467(-)